MKSKFYIHTFKNNDFLLDFTKYFFNNNKPSGVRIFGIIRDNWAKFGVYTTLSSHELKLIYGIDFEEVWYPIINLPDCDYLLQKNLGIISNGYDGSDFRIGLIEQNSIFHHKKFTISFCEEYKTDFWFMWRVFNVEARYGYKRKYKII